MQVTYGPTAQTPGAPRWPRPRARHRDRGPSDQRIQSEPHDLGPGNLWERDGGRERIGAPPRECQNGYSLSCPDPCCRYQIPGKDSMYPGKDSFCHEQGMSQSRVSTGLFVHIYFVNTYIFCTCPFLLWIGFQC
jgi:hypothetical protein